jgi:ribosomal protein S18 acetylase RimI-like enzyme
MRDEILPAHEFPMNRLADVFSRAYTGYIAGNFTMDVPTFARFLSQHGVDLWLSRIFVRNGQPVGFGYINRTGDFSRLASLGVVPEARRQGVGRRLTQLLLEESRERGERAMMLEVIEQNQAAHQLYLQLGFQKVDRLLGWRLNPYPALPHAASLVPDGFREITPLERRLHRLLPPGNRPRPTARAVHPAHRRSRQGSSAPPAGRGSVTLRRPHLVDPGRAS